LSKVELGLHHRNLTNTSLVLEDYSRKLIQYYHDEMLVLTMGLKIVLSLLDFPLTPFQLLHESQHPCYSLNTKKKQCFAEHHEFGVYFHPQPSKDFLPLIMQPQGLKTMVINFFLLKKGINPTPYSPTL